MEIKLQNPIKKDGQKIEKLVLNLKDLKGSDLIKAERECRLRGEVHPNPLFTSTGLMIVAAKASGMIPEDIEGLDAPDFLQVTTTVNNFLYGWILPEKIQSEIYDEQS